jgi:condensin complex subunit 1
VGGRKKKMTSEEEEEASSAAAAGEAAWASWEDQKEEILSSLVNILEVPQLSRLWSLSQPEEDLILLFSKSAVQILENPSISKFKPLRRCASSILASLAVKYDQSISIAASLLHLLHKHEHIASAACEIVEIMTQDHQNAQFVVDILREIGKTNAKEMAQDSTGVKNMATFISELSERQPRLVLANISVLTPLLEGESHTMRSSIVHAIGQLITKACNGTDGASSTTKQSLLDTLEARFYDVTSYTRSKVLQTWSYLAEQRAIPPSRLVSVIQNAVKRLKDKAAQVRKSAIQLITMLMQYNIFSPELRLAEFEAKFVGNAEKLKRLCDVLELAGVTVSGESQEEDKMEEEEKNKSKTKKNGDSKSVDETEEEMQKQKKICEFYEKAVGFIRSIHEGIPVLCQLLGSNNATDVLESIEFFVVASKFSIQKADEGVRKMLMLIWSKDNGVKDALLRSYTTLLLRPSSSGVVKKGSAAESFEIAFNLINVAQDATLGELTSLEELVTLLTKKDFINSQVIQALWEVFSLKSPKFTQEQAQGALIILSMITNARPDVISSKLNTLLAVAFEKFKGDEKIAKHACIALKKITNVEGLKSGQSGRLKADHTIFEKLGELMKDSSWEYSIWCSVAEQAINAIYILHPNPDHFFAPLIKEIAMPVLNPNLAGFSASPASGEEEEEASPPPTMASKCCSAEALSRLFFVLGHVAIKQVVHLCDIQSEMRRKRDEVEIKKEKTKPSKPTKKPASKGGKKASLDDEEDEKEAIEKELGLDDIQATEDKEDELLQQVTEREIVSDNLLGSFAPLLVKVVANTGNNFNVSLLPSHR